MAGKLLHRRCAAGRLNCRTAAPQGAARAASVQAYRVLRIKLGGGLPAATRRQLLAIQFPLIR